MNTDCFYSAQGQLICNKLKNTNSTHQESESLIEKFYAGPVVNQPLPTGNYKNTCSVCKVTDCYMNAQPKTCKLTCNGCAINTTKPIPNINDHCKIKGNCNRSEYRYVLLSDVYNFNGKLMNQNKAETAKAIQDVAIKRALTAAQPVQQVAAVAQPVQLQQVAAVAQPVQQVAAVAQPAQPVAAVAQPAQQVAAVAQPAQPAQPAQTVAAQPAQTVAAQQTQPAQQVATTTAIAVSQPTVQELQQQLLVIQQQLNQATGSTAVASTAEQFKNNYFSYSYSPYKYENYINVK